MGEHVAAGARQSKKPIELNRPAGTGEAAQAQAQPEMDMESNWVRQALDGHVDAFRNLYATYARRIKVYFLRSGFAQAEADDLTQDTFVRVYKSLRTFNPEKGRFSLWVYTIAKNVARRKWSSRAEARSLDPELAEEMLSGGTNPRAAAARQEEIQAVRDCIHRLDESLQQVVRLRYVDALTTRAIGQELSMPEATVRLRLQEAQGHIQRCLQAKGLLQ
ncbi:MAG: RNA polymerase sigma factor [Planctomycetota bacterium]